MQRTQASGALERIDVTEDRPIDWDEYEHRARYAWAGERLGQGEVLDIACGTGHGSQLLANRVRITGVDRDEQAVERARSRCESGRFLAAAVPPFPFAENTFDAVVSFETIEHIEDDLGFIGEVARVLKSRGELLISTPNREVSSPDGDPNNEFHVREYTRAQFEDLLAENGFRLVEMLAQRGEPTAAVGHRLRGLAYRARRLGKRSAWLHGLIFDRILDMNVHAVRPGERPAYWVARAERSAL